MITVTFHTENGLCSGLTVAGHAGYGVHGKDIVCAAVSALVQGTVLSLRALTAGEVSLEQSDGRLECQIRAPDRDSQLLTAGLELAVTQLETEYGGFMEVCHE